MKTNHRVPLYFFLAFLPVIIAAQQPTTGWQWVVLVCSAVYQGGLSVKALYSQSPSKDEQTP